MISQRLGRSMSELFAWCRCLSFVSSSCRRLPGKGTCRRTVLSHGMDRPHSKSMLEIAVPKMKHLVSVIGQSCHLAVRSGNEIVVIARVESSEQIGFSVRVGYRKSLAMTRSGTVMFAFQEESTRQRWERELAADVDRDVLLELKARVETVRNNGYDSAKSDFVAGITDIAAPILRGHTASAALTVPFVHSSQLVMPLADVTKALRRAASEISAELLLADHRV